MVRLTVDVDNDGSLLLNRGTLTKDSNFDDVYNRFRIITIFAANQDENLVIVPGNYDSQRLDQYDTLLNAYFRSLIINLDDNPSPKPLSFEQAELIWNHLDSNVKKFIIFVLNCKVEFEEQNFAFFEIIKKERAEKVNMQSSFDDIISRMNKLSQNNIDEDLKTGSDVIVSFINILDHFGNDNVSDKNVVYPNDIDINQIKKGISKQTIGTIWTYLNDRQREKMLIYLNGRKGTEYYFWQAEEM